MSVARDQKEEVSVKRPTFVSLAAGYGAAINLNHTSAIPYDSLRQIRRYLDFIGDFAVTGSIV